MADERFFTKEPSLSLRQIAQIAEVTVPADAPLDKVFKDVASLEDAGPDDVSWAFIPSVRDTLKQTKAGAVIVPEKFAALVPSDTIALISKDAHRSYGLLAQAFYPVRLTPGISEKAMIDASAVLGTDCEVQPGAVIGPKAHIGDRCRIESNAVIGQGVVLGNDCIVGATATVSHCLAGNKVYFYPGSHVGQDGFGFAMSAAGPVKVPQLGRVVIGDDVEIGSCTTVDRGAMGDTVIGSGTRIDNLVQVAHNVKLGKCCVMVSQVGIAGSCEFGDFVVAGGQVGFAGHLKIGTGAQIAAQSGLMSDVPPKAVMMGSPAVGRMDYMRQVLALKNLTQKKEGGMPVFSWKLACNQLINRIKRKK